MILSADETAAGESHRHFDWHGVVGIAERDAGVDEAVVVFCVGQCGAGVRQHGDIVDRCHRDSGGRWR